MIRIVIPGVPRGKARARATVIAGRARMFTPKVTASEEGAVRLFASQAMRGQEPIRCAVDFRMTAFMPVPASWSTRKRQLALDGEIVPTGRPDLDNIVKLATDGCNAIVWADDAQIVSVAAWKRYSAEPRVVLEVRLAGAGSVA